MPADRPHRLREQRVRDGLRKLDADECERHAPPELPERVREWEPKMAALLRARLQGDRARAAPVRI